MQKTVSKLSENGLGCSSRIPDQDFFHPDPDSGSRGKKSTGSRFWIYNTVPKSDPHPFGSPGIGSSRNK